MPHLKRNKTRYRLGERKKRKKTHSEQSISDIVHRGDKIKFSNTAQFTYNGNYTYVVKDIIRNSILLVQSVCINSLEDHSQEEIPCIVHDNAVYTKVLHRRLIIITKEPWREALVVGSTVKLYKERSSFLSVVVKRSGNVVTVQPFGSDLSFDVNVNSYTLFQSSVKIEGYRYRAPLPPLGCMYDTIICNDGSWIGCIVDTDSEFNLCLVRKHGRDANHGTDMDTANHMWLPVEYVRTHTRIDRHLDAKFDMNVYLGSFTMKRETYESSKGQFSYPWESWQKMHTHGDIDLILNDIYRVSSQYRGERIICPNDPDLAEGLAGALEMAVAHSTLCEFPHFNTTYLSNMCNGEDQFNRINSNILDMWMRESLQANGDRETSNTMMKRYFNIMNPDHYKEYIKCLRLNRLKHSKRIMSLTVVAIDDTHIELGAYYNGEPPPGYLTQYRQRRAMECSKRVAFSLQRTPVPTHPELRSIRPSDFQGVFDSHKPWYDSTVYYHGQRFKSIKLFHYQNMMIMRMFKREQVPNVLSHCFEGDLNGMKYNMLCGSHNRAIQNSTGALLVMDPGLGKTICVLGLYSLRPLKTLIVVPLSLLDQWKGEISKHLPHVATTECYGRKKNLDGDIVVTTYGTVRTMYQKNMFITCFERVVFDESHTLLDPCAVSTRACTSIVGRNRWCLTATAISNNTFQSLESQLAMLNVAPFQRCGRHTYLKDNLEYGRTLEREYNIVDTIVTKIMMVLTKNGLKQNKLSFDDVCVDHKCIELPKITPHYDYLHARLSAALKSPGRCRYNRLISSSNLLQICTVSPALVPLYHYAHEIEDTVNSQTMDTVVKRLGNSEYDQTVKQSLENLSTTTCSICFDELERPTITPCSHLFCNECITLALQHKRQCPLCRTQVTHERLVEISTNPSTVEVHGDEVVYYDIFGRKCRIVKSFYEQWNTLRDTISESPKLMEVQKIVDATDESVVVFSQHSVVLKALKDKFPHAEIITGRSTRPQRKLAIENFQQKRSKIFILSTRCASVGLTLTSGSNIVFMEALLDETILKQAVGRIARTGQPRSVLVHTLVTPGTFDTAFLELRGQYDQVGLTEEKKLKHMQKTFKTSVLLRLFNC
jgi:superfamily II DNA or RNA helicase